MKKRVVILSEEEFDQNVRMGSAESVLTPAELKSVQSAHKRQGAAAKRCQITYCVVMPDAVI